MDQSNKPKDHSGFYNEPIAIVGMACRFPGIASSIDGYWQLLSQGLHVVSDIPLERFDSSKYFDSNPDAANKTYVKKGAFIDDVSEFDAQFFGISPREAIAMDPQQRILLECSWEALEDSGVAPDSLNNSKTGVFVGCIDSEYRYLLEASQNSSEYETLIPTGAFAGAVAGRLSYIFGFAGPSMVIDTHYSASLVALNLACQSLSNGECDRALAGGVHFILSPEGYILFSRNHTLSPDGYSKTFDIDGNGFGRGEGCGVLVLKRLCDAIQDGDRIHAVIRGSAVNQDGHSSSMTAPNEVAQENLIKAALTAAKISPNQISYIEAHGTGTPLGDPIEVQALGAVLQVDRNKDNPLYIASVKTNIGHLEAAAGIAGVIKTVLALKHKQIPAHLHFHKLNPNINLDVIPALIPTALTQWQPIAGQRIAGVSSFGLSGTNAHVILEEAPEPISQTTTNGSDPKRDFNILCISAKNQAALKVMVQRYIDNLKVNNGSIADICYSANSGRAHLKQALAFVASSKDDLLEHLSNWQQSENDNKIVATSVDYKDGKIAFLFTGGGAQYVGMGKRLYETCGNFKTSIDTCSKILESSWEYSLQSIMWGEHSDLLDRMDYMQPALFSLEYALAQLWMSWGIKPDAVIGHSLGEYVAATIAGVFSLDDGLTLIAKRAKFMHIAPGNGAMASIAASEADVIEVLKSYSGKVSIGALNGPVSTIISGDREKVIEVLGLFEAKGIKVKLLPISNASHSPMMEPVLDDFEKEALKVKYSSPKITIISNVSGKVIDSEIGNATYWKQHIRQTVRFNDGMRTLYELGCRYFIEMGPQSTLLGMGQACVPQTALGVSEGHWISSLEKDKSDWEVLLTSLGSLYAQGINVDWHAFENEHERHKVDVPTYAFQRQSYWVDKEVEEELESSNQLVLQPNIIAGNEFIQKLSAATSAERKDLMHEYLKSEVRKILGFSKNTPIDLHVGIMSIGVTSVLAGELKNRITLALGSALTGPLPQALIFNYPTVEAIADYLLSEVLQLEQIKKTTFKSSEYSQEAIAIIGMGCRFPGGANSLAEYWRILSQGIDAIAEIPKQRFDVNQYYDADLDAPMKIYMRGGGFVEDADLFDAEFFSISPREATALDPQQRLLLEVSWEALENARIAADSLFGSNTGVFVGISNDGYSELVENSPERESFEAHLATGNLISTAAGRISYSFGFQGPALSVDTACSSSLTAIHLACESLRANSCDTALAAGVNVLASVDSFIDYCKIRALSPDSHCKTFDKSADGYARGEGCGVLVLKRLSEAIADNDNICAVIKGSALNQDGRSSSLTAPNGAAQELLIREALYNADIKPNQISYVEAHGTGTPLGDPIEVRSLGRVLSEGRTQENPLILGSAKTNIGHLEAAAGMAGVIKTVLSLQHKQIPKHLNFNELNPEIDLSKIPAKIPNALIDWPVINGKRIAGISSFGISGTNAHVIIEEAGVSGLDLNQKNDNVLNRNSQILCISARTPEALLNLTKKYVDTTLTNTKYSISDICYSAAVTRNHFDYRLAVTGNDAQQLKTNLIEWINNGESTNIVTGNINTAASNKIAFLFTGQGSQYAGMGKELYDNCVIFKNNLDQCAKILEDKNYIDKPLLSILWGEDSKLIDETKYTQPALFALEYALSKLWMSWGISPSAVIGHSVGEYVAACVAGVFSLEDGLKLISKRAALMQSLPQNGAMAAIAVSEQVMFEAIKPYASKISIAAINGPESIVISGNIDVVKNLVAEFAAKNIKTKELQVSHAFHSHLLEPMLADFESVLCDAKFAKPEINIISNLTGAAVSVDEITTPEYWVKHTRNAVRFNDGVKALVDIDISNFIEIGPHPVLLGMAQECIFDFDSKLFLPSLRKDKDSWQQVSETLAELYVFGVKINWDTFYAGYSFPKIQLPTYTFQKKKYWIKQAENIFGEYGIEQNHLLGHIIDTSGLDGVHIIESYYTNSDEFVHGHKVYGWPIVPAAAHIARLLCAAFDVLKQNSIRITEIDFQRPVIIEDNNKCIVRLIIVKNGNDEYNFQILSTSVEISNQYSKNWIKNVEGKFDFILDNQGDSNEALILDVKNRCDKELDANTFNEYNIGNSFNYGPSYQWLEKIYIGDNEALAFMRAAVDLDDIDNLILHPGQIDCAFQTLACIGLSQFNIAIDGSPGIIIEVGEFSLYARPKGKLVCHTALLSGQTIDQLKQQIKADITLYDEFGNLIATIKSVVTAKVSMQQIERSMQKQPIHSTENLVYNVEWITKNQDLTTLSSGEQIKGKWLVISLHDSILANLVDYMDSFNDVIITANIANSYSEIATMHVNFNPTNIDDIDKLLDFLIKNDCSQLSGIVYILADNTTDLGFVTEDYIINSQRLGYGAILDLARSLVANEEKISCGRFVVITSHAVAAVRSEFVNPFQTTISGLLKVINMEAPHLNCHLLDVPVLNTLGADELEVIVKVLKNVTLESELAIRGNDIYVPRLVTDKLISTLETQKFDSLKTDATYVITGGLGALGLLFATHLVSLGAKNLVLIGRKDVSLETQLILDKLLADNVNLNITVHLIDIADLDSVSKLFSNLKQTMQPIAGIIHAAGVIDDAPLSNQDFDKYLNIIRAKILGTWSLHLNTKDIKLDFMILFSSISSLFGNAGQANYAAANAFMDGFAAYRKSIGLPAISVNWGPWGEIGMAAKLNKVSTLNAAFKLLDSESGVLAFDKLLTYHKEQVAIVDVNWDALQYVESFKNNTFYRNFLTAKSTKIKKLETNNFLNKFFTLDLTEQKSTILELVRSEVAKILHLESMQKVDINKPLIDHGLDSLMAVMLRNKLKEILGNSIKLKSSLIFDYPNVSALSNYISKELLSLGNSDFKHNVSQPSQKKSHTKYSNEPLAIIGVSCRFPGGANSLDEYWQLLYEGRDAIVEVPDDRWSLDEYYDPDPDAAGKMYCKWGGFLNTPVQNFDAKFFDIVPIEAQTMDPQQRLILEVTWEAFENAGLDPLKFSGSQTGVFLGISTSDYAELTQEIPNIISYTNSGINRSVLAGRISYIFGFKGPSFVLDTACSSSLVAIHQASTSLRTGESNLAVVGGVNLMLTPSYTIGFCKGGYLSPDGRCKTFDDSANGYVRGEGVGVVILKRLSDAKRDGDEIYAVIRGSAVDQDGASGGLTVPNGPAQEQVIMEALLDGDVSPHEVNYIEAHGTGTSLGDPIEVHALINVYKQGREDQNKQPLTISSVKTNIGHLEAAAGMAGIIKIILAMQHDTIPKHLHFKELNRNISLDDDIDIVIPTEKLEWKRGKHKRIAGISGFAFQGTNAHVILEEAPQVKEIASLVQNQVDRPSHVLVISAKSIEALQDLSQSYIELLSQNSELSNYFANLSFSANNFRSQFNQRLAIVGSDAVDAQAKLQAWLETGESLGVVNGEVAAQDATKSAFLLTGQGSQYVGMGRELYDASPTFKKHLDICAEILSKNNYLDKPLLSLLWGDASNLLDNTKYTQPALFALEYALCQLWMSWGITPSALIGHSVGEYVAACVAGVFSLEDGLKLISKRAALMQALPQNGAMAAIAVREDVIFEAIKSYESQVSIAAINGPESVVISGNIDAVKKLTDEFAAKGIKTKELQVSHAFHSHLLEPMLSDFEAVLREIKFVKPNINLISNLTGAVVSGDNIITPEYWVKHTRQSVRFSDCINTLVNLGIISFIEIGPSPILLGMAQECVAESDSHHRLFLPSLRKDKDSWAQILESFGSLWVSGSNVNWKDFDKDYNRHKVQLPTYPFQRQRYWIEAVNKSKLNNINPEHALLGLMIKSAIHENEVIFNSEISLNTYPYLIDHQVYGNVIVPGAAYIEMAIAAAGEVFKQKITENQIIEIQNLLIEQPLVLPVDDTDAGIRAIQVVIEGESWQILSRQSDKWIRHVSGSMALTDGVSNTIDIEDIKQRCDVETAVMDLYKQLDTIGLKYGVLFQGLKKLYSNSIEALGEISLPIELNVRGYVLHPALLDTCFHVMLGLFIGQDDSHDIYLPFEIEKIDFYGKLEPEVIAYARLEESRDSKVKKASISICDVNGNLLVVLQGFSAVRTSNVELSQLISSQLVNKVNDLLYELKWREQVLPQIQNESEPSEPKSWYILAEDNTIAAKLSEVIKQSGDTIVLELDNTQAQLDRVVYIPNNDVNLENIARPNCAYEQALELTQQLVKNKILKTNGKLIFVTSCAQAVNDVQSKYTLSQAPLIGFARVIAIEHPDLNSRVIDLDVDDLDIETLLAELNANHTNIETQVAFRQGVRFVPRLVRYTKELHPYIDDTYLGFSARGVIENLEFKPLTRKALSSNEVEIEVKAAGLNFRDVLNIMRLYPGDPGPLGGECAGVITAIGSNVANFKVGDEVLAEAPGAFAKFVTTSYQLVAKKPSNMSFADAAAIPIVFLTVHYALNILAQLKAGEKILIHAAAGGVGMAAIQIAKNIGAEIFVTVGSDAKRKLMQDMGIPDDHLMNSRNTEYAVQIMQVTGNKGVDVVLNSLTGGDFVPKSLSTLSPNGRFLEIGKRDIWTVEQVKECRADVVYSIIAIDLLSQEEPDLIGKILVELMQEFDSGNLKPIPVTQYPITQAKQAFKFMAQGKHVGKIVLTMQDENIQNKLKPITIKTDATYLITGGFGGLGLEVAKWLAAKGATSLALLGRNKPSAHAQEIISNLEDSRVTVKIIQIDISKPQDVENIFKQHSIQGIIHAAGVLDDATLMHQDFRKYIKVINPKIIGALNLQHAIEKNNLNQDLDFFVSFSSITSVLGNVGQSNYAAANAFLDTLAFYQRQINIPGFSINWGAWAQVGLAVNMDKASIEQISLSGMRMFSPKDGLAALEKILLHSPYHSQVVMADINWNHYLTQINTQAQRFLKEISINTNKYNKLVQFEKNNEFIQSLTQANDKDRHELMSEYLETEVKKILGLNIAIAMDRNAGLTAMGMDSLMAVEFRNRITKTLGASFSMALPATLMFNYPNITSLSKYLLTDVLLLERKEIPVNASLKESQYEQERADALMTLSEDELDSIVSKLIDDNEDHTANDR